VSACANFRTSLGCRSPYKFAHSGGLDRLLQRLLEGAAPCVLETFFAPGDGVPFPDPDHPPGLVRVGCYWFEPKPSLMAALRTGVWWEAPRWMHLHSPPRANDPTMWERWLPTPEMFHPDHRSWRRQALSGDTHGMPLGSLGCGSVWSHWLHTPLWHVVSPAAAALTDALTKEPRRLAAEARMHLRRGHGPAPVAQPELLLDRELLDDGWAECHKARMRIEDAEEAIAAAVTQDEVMEADTMARLLPPMAGE
jgi:hypothetical protein